MANGSLLVTLMSSSALGLMLQENRNWNSLDWFIPAASASSQGDTESNHSGASLELGIRGYSPGSFGNSPGSVPSNNNNKKTYNNND